MKIEKIKAHELEKCYSIASLTYRGKKHILVAAEKVNNCLLFDLDGNLEETVWSEPGGTMSMVQVPGSDGQFLATQKFYSPNDSKETKIVLVTPCGINDWKVQTIAKLPFTHRFDIVTRGGVNYLIACTLKSEHKCKDDWSSPGKIWVCELPDHLEKYNEEHLLSLTAIQEGLLKNHGYYRMTDVNGMYSLVGTENGIFRVTPPEEIGEKWKIEQLTSDPASDMAMADFDGDGKLEMITIAPFHGEQIKIYKEVNGSYQMVYQYEKETEFGHSIWAGSIYGKMLAIIGHRKGKRDILAFTYEDGIYHSQILDSNVGSANIMIYEKNDKWRMVSTNREIDEIAFYQFEA